jgi:hypothetical protein
MLQHFQNKQNLQPIDQSVQTAIGKQMRSTLDDSSIPDDVKAKQYMKQLNRLLHTKRELIEEPKKKTRYSKRLKKEPKWEHW